MISGLYKNTKGARENEIETADALLKVEGGVAVLVPSASAMLAQFEREAKAIEEKQKELRKRIQAEMEKNGIIKIDTDELTITYVAPTTREQFDNKKFRADKPDLYDEYVKISSVSACVKITMKGERK